MGVCESSHESKKDEPIKIQNSEISENNNNQEDENTNNLETHQSSNINLDNKEESKPENQNNKCPELAKYERSAYQSGKRSENSHINNTQSMFSSGITEEEVIIKGEINPNCQNKEEDFDNNSFKKLVKNNGGIVIKNIDNISNIGSSRGVNSSIFDFGKETISEIKSKHSFPFRQINGKIGSSLRGSGIKQDLVYNTMSEKNRITNHLKNNIKLKNLGESYKINISMQDNYQFLNVPKVDEPLPDIEELSSGSPIFIGRNSLISE